MTTPNLPEGLVAPSYDTTSLKIIVSSGVMWTSEVKEQILDRVPP